jgi:hypothetical protein
MNLTYEVATGVVNTDLIARIPDVPVRWAVPNPRPAVFITVYRTGNTDGPKWSDPAAFDVHCWDTSPKAAHELANRVKAALNTMPERVNRVATTRITGDAFLPDPVSGAARVIVGVNIMLRPRAA